MLDCSDFNGIDLVSDRSYVPVDKLAWCDNWMPFGKGKLLPLPASNPAFYNANALGKTIWSFDFFELNGVNFVIVFHTDGSSIVLNLASAADVGSQAAGTYATGGNQHPQVSGWGGTQGLVVSPVVGGGNGYYSFNGTAFTGYPISGNTIETYGNRVWIAFGRIVSFTAAASYSDFTTADGGGTFPSYDGLLRDSYLKLIQSIGNLYEFGDSSIAYIAGVQTSSTTPPVTTFTNQNIDPQTGTLWPDTVKTYGRAIIFANQFGVHILYGGTVDKISTELDSIFADARTQAAVAANTVYTPSAAVVTLNGRRCYSLLLPVFNPIAQAVINTMLIWDGKRWFSSTQIINDTGATALPILWINQTEQNSQLSSWATDGEKLYQLFVNPPGTGKGTPLNYQMQTKLWYDPNAFTSKNIIRLYMVVRDGYSPSNSLYYTLDNETTYNEGLTSSFVLGINSPLALYYYDVNLAGHQVGITISTSAPITLVSVSLGIRHYRVIV
jgi:hypothetical protein